MNLAVFVSIKRTISLPNAVSHSSLSGPLSAERAVSNEPSLFKLTADRAE
jgi:hypothetical protein